MKKLLLSTAVTAMIFAGGQAHATQTIYFGENLTPGGAVTGDPVTARGDFLGALSSGVSTEDFEGFANGATPTDITFSGSGGDITASFASGSGNVDGSPAFGRFATSGSNIFEVSGSFLVTFSDPIAAFGFYGTDIGDFNGQVTLELIRAGEPNEIVVIPNTLNAPNGSLLFFGIVDASNPFTGLSFGNTSAGTDFFGFDDLVIGDVGQVTGAVPEPATWAMMLLGFFAIGGAMRRSSSRVRSTKVSYA